MNIHDLRQAQANFTIRIDDIIEGRKELYNKRTAFAKHFNTNKIEKMELLNTKLMKSYQDNRELKNRVYESGLIYYEEFYPSKSKPIIDEIDTLLAQHYGFTDEELDFIINL